MVPKEMLYFKTIADTKSFSKAAQILYVTQPSLSHYIQRLESTLSTKLFIRTIAGLEMTEPGKKYYQAAAEVLRIYENLHQELNRINNLEAGQINIGMTTYITSELLPQVLPKFNTKYPNIDVIIHEHKALDLESELSMHRFDFGLIHIIHPAESDKNAYGLSYYTLSREDFVLVLPHEGKLRNEIMARARFTEPYFDLTALEGQPFILTEKKRRSRQVADRILQSAGITPKTALTVSNYETARILATQGIGATFIPRGHIEKSAVQRNTPYYSIDPALSPFWNLCVALPQNGHITVSARAFLETMIDASPYQNILPLLN